MTYLYLTLAIIAEVIATSALKATGEFSKLLPSLIVITGYVVSFYFLTQVLKTLPIGITYAIWSGLGIVLVSIASAVFYKQIPDMAAILGMSLIIAGVTIIFIFSKATNH